jgi:hypothetical protein
MYVCMYYLGKAIKCMYVGSGSVLHNNLQQQRRMQVYIHTLTPQTFQYIHTYIHSLHTYITYIHTYIHTCADYQKWHEQVQQFTTSESLGLISKRPHVSYSMYV